MKINKILTLCVLSTLLFTNISNADTQIEEKNSIKIEQSEKQDETKKLGDETKKQDIEKVEMNNTYKDEREGKLIYKTNTIKFIAKTPSGERLKDGEWEVKDKKTDKVVAKFLITNSTNEFIKELEKGEYQLYQTKAPEGYIKDSKILEFKTPISVKNKGDVFEIYPKVMEKEKTTPKPKETPYKTGMDKKLMIALAIASGVIAGAIVSIIKRRQNNAKK